MQLCFYVLNRVSSETGEFLLGVYSACFGFIQINLIICWFDSGYYLALMFLLCVRVGTLATMQYIKILKKSYFMEFVSMNQDDNV